MVVVVVTVAAGEIIKMKDIGNDFFEHLQLWTIHQDLHKPRKNSVALCKLTDRSLKPVRVQSWGTGLL